MMRFDGDNSQREMNPSFKGTPLLDSRSRTAESETSPPFPPPLRPILQGPTMPAQVRVDVFRAETRLYTAVFSGAIDIGRVDPGPTVTPPEILGTPLVQADGTTRLAYGGQFGEQPHDGNFVADGLVDSYGVPHPAMREVAWVIFDEVHYMRDKERGVVWEETIIMLSPNVKYVFLSATIPNAREFCEWIVKIKRQPCSVVYTDFRPTPL